MAKQSDKAKNIEKYGQLIEEYNELAKRYAYLNPESIFQERTYNIERLKSLDYRKVIYELHRLGDWFQLLEQRYIMHYTSSQALWPDTKGSVHQKRLKLEKFIEMNSIYRSVTGKAKYEIPFPQDYETLLPTFTSLTIQKMTPLIKQVFPNFVGVEIISAEELYELYKIAYQSQNQRYHRDDFNCESEEFLTKEEWLSSYETEIPQTPYYKRQRESE